MRLDKRAFAPPVIAMSIKERDLLYRLYVEKDKTAQEIAERFGVSERSVYTRLKEHGISKDGYAKRKPVYCPTCGQQWQKKKAKKK